MKFKILTTGAGMLRAGKYIGDLEAKDYKTARKKLNEMCAGKGVIWDLEEIKDD